MLERVKGIEPSYAAWEAAVLPLNYTRGGHAFLAQPRATMQSIRSVAGSAPAWLTCLRSVSVAARSRGIESGGSNNSQWPNGQFVSGSRLRSEPFKFPAPR